MDADVLIVGAGPVGMITAIDLAARGVGVIVVETRGAGTAPSAKCNHVSARSMEALRRLGLVEEVRAAGLPHDHPHDVVFRTRLTGPEMARIPIPSRDGRRSPDRRGPDADWPTPEPPHRINQIYFEPILFRRMQASAGVTVFDRHEAKALRQDADCVTLTIGDCRDGASRELRARYLIGCDGGRSMVRRAIGARLDGDAVIQRVQTSHIRMPGLIDRIPGERGWMTYCYNAERAGTALAIDGREQWLVHNYLLPDEPDFDSVDRDRCLRAILGVPDLPYEILGKEDWFGRRLVADSFRDRRVFLCGDAAHLWVPYGGYGMNAGIADGLGLSWLLAAHIAGWAPASILDAYTAERQPITEQVSRFAMRHAEQAIRERTTLPPEIESDSACGAAARARVGEAAYRLNVQQFACAGLNFGYYYESSPIIADDDEAAPAYTMADYTPSTVPGCRTPHVWLGDGASLYDRTGAGYCLIAREDAPDPGPLIAAADARGLPLSVLRVGVGELPPVYRHALLVTRPDQHVAWRGDALPPDPFALVDRLRGAAGRRRAP